MINNLVSVGPPLAAATGVKKDFSKNEDVNNKKTFLEELKSKSDDKNFSARKNDRKEDVRENEKSKLSDKSEKPDKLAEKKTRSGSNKNKEDLKKSLSVEELVAISNFMASVESELEIPPAKILEAMATDLNTDQMIKGESAMAAVPAQSLMQSLADKLSLNSQDTKQLQQLGEKFLSTEFQTRAELQQKVALANDKLGMEVLSNAGKVQESSDLEAKLAKAGLLSNEMQQKLSAEALGQSFFKSDALMASKHAASVNPLQMPEQQLLNSLHQMNEKFWMKPQVVSADNVSTQALSEIQNQFPMAEFNGIGAEDLQGVLGADFTAPTNFINSSMQQPVAGEINFFNRSLQNEVKEGLDEDKLSALKEFSELGELGAGSLLFMGPDGHKMTLNDLKAMQNLSQPLTENQKAENLQKLLGESSYLVKNGGGEMKVRLHPEGLGQVDIKVVLQDGKVQLEMLTESKEAKKLLDSQLLDLKLGLAAQKLSIENIRIDQVNNVNTDQSTQLFMNLNSQGQAQQDLRQLWSQMNDFGSQARKSSYFEMSAPKQDNSNRGALKSASESGAAKTQRYDGRGRGVNLVA